MKNRTRLAIAALIACFTVCAPVAAQAAGTLSLYADPN